MKEERKEKLKVIYIAGSGHSGSTLMDLILGSSPNALGLGELKFLDNFFKKEKRGVRMSRFKDDTGEELENSFFWKSVVEKIKSENIKIYPKQKKVELLKFFVSIVKPLSLKNKNNKNELFEILFQRAQEVKGGQVEFLIDSSKTLSPLFYLSQSSNIEIYALHLIRDGRGFLYSHKKRGNNLILSFLKWVKGNLLLSLFLNRCIDKNKRIRISYDLFANNPEFYIEKINNKFGLKIDPNNYLDIINSEPSYRFAGNSVRRKNLKEIKKDQSWEDNFSYPIKLIFNIITYIPNKIWVYGNR